MTLPKWETTDHHSRATEQWGLDLGVGHMVVTGSRYGGYSAHVYFHGTDDKIPGLRELGALEESYPTAAKAKRAVLERALTASRMITGFIAEVMANVDEPRPPPAPEAPKPRQSKGKVKVTVEEPRPRHHHGNLCCSFCGKAQRDVAKLIAGPTVYICGACVLSVRGLLAGEVPTTALTIAPSQPSRTGHHCHFCGKGDQEVRIVFGKDARICHECIDLCLQILAEDGAEAPKALSPAPTAQLMLPAAGSQS